MSYHGTRWYKTDLHLHTPASKCFRNKDVTAEEWVNRCIEQGLDVVAVTDHNTGKWIDKIKKASEGKNLTVFPGVEVTCSESKVHMLVLFDTCKGSQDVEDFLIKLNIEREAFATAEANSPKSTIEVVEIANQSKAIVIPAHIDEYNGLSEISYTNREKLFNCKHISSVQVVHKMFYENEENISKISSNLQEYYGKEISKEMARGWKSVVKHATEKDKSILTFSDNPHKEGDSQHGLWGIGKRFTWIKMNEKVNLESLKQALMISNHRIRNDFDSENVPYSPPSYWIENIKVKNTTLNNSEIEVPLSPQMNSIIGGRGSGKSSILRFFRGVFGKIEDLEYADKIGASNLKKEQENFFKINSNNSGVLRSKSIIEIQVNKHGTKYLIIAKDFNNRDSFSIEVLKKDINGKYEKQEVKELEDFFKFQIYSQKQIYEIASHPNSLRKIIDESIGHMNKLKGSIEIKKNEYLEQATKIRSLQSRINRKSKVISDIKDMEEQISSFKESGYEELVKKFKIFNRENELFESLKQNLNKHEEEIVETIGRLKLNKINTRLLESGYQDEINTILTDLSIAHDEVLSLLAQAKEDVFTLKEKFSKDLLNSSWNNNRMEIKKEFTETKKVLEEKGVDDLDKLEIASKELRNLERELEEIKVVEEKMNDEKTKLTTIYDEYLELRKEVSDYRSEFLKRVLDGKDLKINIKKYRDLDHYIQGFRNIIQKDKGFMEDLQKIRDKCQHGSNVIKNHHSIIEDLLKIKKDSPTSYGGHFQNLVKSLSDDQIDRLRLHLPEDQIEIMYKSNASQSFQRLSNASAGQKTSAILTFLLSHGNIPLILDQPEDDLDNHLIYELIVERLKKVKENRQIIVVTHNANIPVNGDTELLIAMNSNSKDIEVLNSGVIEERDIRTEICDVMEGGSRAFELRAERYNLS